MTSQQEKITNYSGTTGLAAAFALLIGLLIAVAGLALNRMGRLDNDINALAESDWMKAKLSREALACSSDNNRITLEVFLLHNQEEMTPLLVEGGRNSKKISTLLEKIAPLVSDLEEQRLLTALKAARQPYVEGYQAALQLLLQDQKSEAARAAMVEQVMPLLTIYHDAWSQFMKYQGAQMDARARAAESNYATTRLQVLLLSFSAVLCALGVALFATRAVGRETAERKRAQASLELANDDLESRVLERTRELENVHKKLLETSRLAGMAEVATTVLHNVGNVLNSVNISANMISDRLKNSKGNNVAKAAALMDEHADHLAEFMTQDPKGRQLPTFLKQLGGRLEEEKHAILQESASLAKNVDHIKDIIAAQQSYAKIAGVTETFKITEALEVALSMNASALARHDVRVSREYDPAVPAVTLERHKVLQILVNVIRNAKQACDEAAPTEKHLTIRVTTASGRVRVALTDNGIGIAAENLTRIFNHGFTTKKEGHGFGMHSGALAAKEMGGSLSVQSAGPGTGATVTLELPCQPSAPKPATTG